MTQLHSDFLKEGPLTPFKTGETILSSTHLSGHIGLIEQGCVKVIASLSAQDKEMTIGVYGPHQWIGLERIKIREGRFRYVAATPVTIKAVDVDWALNDMPRPLFNTILIQLADGLLRESVVAMSQQFKLKRRLILALLRVRICYPEGEIEFSLEDFADLVGSSKSHVSPLIKEIEEHQLIERGYRYYLLGSSEQLHAYLKSETTDADGTL